MIIPGNINNVNLFLENCRREGNKLYNLLENYSVKNINIKSSLDNVKSQKLKEDIIISYIEGLAFTAYQFLKYKSQKSKYKLDSISSEIIKNKTRELQNIFEGISYTKNLINEPFSFLTAPQLSKEIKKIAKKSKLKVTVFDKKKIVTEWEKNNTLDC